MTTHTNTKAQTLAGVPALCIAAADAIVDGDAAVAAAALSLVLVLAGWTWRTAAEALRNRAHFCRIVRLAVALAAVTGGVARAASLVGGYTAVACAFLGGAAIGLLVARSGGVSAAARGVAPTRSPAKQPAVAP